MLRLKCSPQLGTVHTIGALARYGLITNLG